MKRTMTEAYADRKGERGSILAISAFGMLALVLALGLCVDVSHWYVVKAELQNAADASALAGASALNSAPADATPAAQPEAQPKKKEAEVKTDAAAVEVSKKQQR